MRRATLSTVVVVDASALVDLLLATPNAAWVAGRIASTEFDLHVPEHCDLEVMQSFRRPLRTGAMARPRASLAVQDYLDLPLTRHRHRSLLTRVLELRDNFTAYDAVYVALAERVRAREIVTTDLPFARAVERHGAVAVVAP